MVALGLVSFAACSQAAAPTPEMALRTKLGIPAAAQTVLVFAQTAHLDIDWQKTFSGYYTSYVENILREARGILDAQPRAFYSVAEMAFLKHHVAAHPEETAPLVAHARRGALRVVGGGMTSPDTLLPETELLARDFLFGTSFAAEFLGVRPRAAWLPDSFGHAATAPDLLAAAGFESVAFARIDGAPTLYEELQSRAPWAGSNASRLRELGSHDFLWRGPGGGVVLGHLLGPNLYCTGDDIDYAEPVTLPGLHLGTYHGDDPDYTDAMIDRYLAALRPLAKTPYLFVPVGCDFQSPKPKLLQYLDGYNARRLRATGVYTVAATFEEYAQLVLAHREKLPTIDSELSPYFMGFYGTRPGLKRRIREAARPFFVAETFATVAGAAGRQALAAAMPAFERLTHSNHHDFVTGTANDFVVASEQLPLLDETEREGRRALEAVAGALAARIPAAPDSIARVLVLNAAQRARNEVVEAFVVLPSGVGAERLRAATEGRDIPIEAIACSPASACEGGARVRFDLRMEAFSWRVVDFSEGAAVAPVPGVTLELLDAGGQAASGAAVTRVRLSNARVRATFERERRFVLSSLVVDGHEAIARSSFIDARYRDSGGLWRLGHEMPGCDLARLEEGDGEDDVQVLVQSPLRAAVRFRGGGVSREAWLDTSDGGLSLATTSAASEGTTRTTTFSFAIEPGATLRTSLAAGYADRAERGIYSPTFWPAVSWVSSGPWSLLLRQSTGARLGANGEVELLTVRDARQEQCDIEGGTGSDPEAHRIEWRIERTASPAEADLVAQAFNRPAIAFAVPQGPAPADPLPSTHSLASITGEGVVMAIKPAHRGDGIVLRTLLLPGPVDVSPSPALGVREAVRTDLVERDLEPLVAHSGTLRLDRARHGSIATVRWR